MRDHPYRSAPPQAFWSRAVLRTFEPRRVPNVPTPLITQSDRVMTAGSCFAANLTPYLTRAGIHLVRTEERHGAFRPAPPEALGYENFSAAYGNIYTITQMLQLFRRAYGEFTPAESHWISPDGRFIDPFRPGLRYAARSAPEFELLTRQHLRAVQQAFETATVLIFTLGLTEAWTSRADGAVYPACPGTIAGDFDSNRHVFKNFSVTEVTEDLIAFVSELRSRNPRVRVILTVSPVPLVATATNNHVLAATIYSKSVLRVAAQQAVETLDNVHYFPAYEIVAGPQAPWNSYRPDRREVSVVAVRSVMDAFFACCEIDTEVVARPAAPPANTGAELSAALGEIECEEAAVEL